MKVTIKEAMKQVSIIDKDIEKLLDFERRESKVVYLKGEAPQESTYDYSDVTKKIDVLEDKKRNIKIAIIKANAKTKTSYNDLTISEVLICLAQNSSKQRRLLYLSDNKQLERITTRDGQIEYTECRFNPVEVQKELSVLEAEAVKLQIAIDRANLLTEINI